jgi:hypothetical protein
MTHLSADLYAVYERLARKHDIAEIKQYMRDSLSPVLSQEERKGTRWFMNREGTKE